MNMEPKNHPIEMEKSASTKVGGRSKLLLSVNPCVPFPGVVFMTSVVMEEFSLVAFGPPWVFRLPRKHQEFVWLKSYGRNDF